MMKPQIRMLLLFFKQKIASPHPLPLSQKERGDMVLLSLWERS